MHEESCCSDFLFIYYFFLGVCKQQELSQERKVQSKAFHRFQFVCFVIFEKDVNISLFQINQSFCYNETDNIFSGFVYAAPLFNT